jgi:hypothetical protein
MKRYFIICLLFINYIAISEAKVYEQKLYHTPNKDSNDVSVIMSSIEIIENKALLIFDIDAKTKGDYYLSAWILGGEIEDTTQETLISYNVMVNNRAYSQRFNASKNSWHNACLTNKNKEPLTIFLEKGKNQIIFSTYLPQIPQIEKIVLTQSLDKLNISESAFISFIEEIKLKEKTSLKESEYSIYKHTRPTDKTAAPFDYYFREGVNFKYTTYKTVYHRAGEMLNVRVWGGDSPPFIVDIFSASTPDLYSWSKQSDDFDNEVIQNIIVPVSDLYYIKLRTLSENTEALVSLRVNGVRYNNSPVTLTELRQAHFSSGEYNYFTCHLLGDSRIWIEDNTHKIKGFNDDYTNENGDFYWGLASRVKKGFLNGVSSVHVSSYSSSNPSGICDIYYKCKNSMISYSHAKFPLLKHNDAVKSAAQTSAYNCISWSVGVHTSKYWPPTDYFQPWYNPSHTDLEKFDSFYQYHGYTRTDATPHNSSIALWFNPIFFGKPEYTHASVRKPANNHPHGFDWESKEGNRERFFHPRNALYNRAEYGYGFISQYYKIINEQNSLAESKFSTPVFEESLVPDKYELTDAELDFINKMVSKIEPSQHKEFEKLYSQWSETWKNPILETYSNPRVFANSDEYNTLLRFCKKTGINSWGLLFLKYIEGDYYAHNTFEDLTLSQYNFCVEQIRNDNITKVNDVDGLLLFSSELQWIKYIKLVINEMRNDKKTIAKKTMNMQHHQDNLFAAANDALLRLNNSQYIFSKTNTSTTLLKSDNTGYYPYLKLDSIVDFQFTSNLDSIRHAKIEYKHISQGIWNEKGFHYNNLENKWEESFWLKEFEANTQGQITRQTHYEFNNYYNKWEGWWRKEYDFDSLGNKTKEASYIWDLDDNIWHKDKKSEFVFDESKEIAVYGYIGENESDTWQFYYKKETEYNENGNVEINETWDSSVYWNPFRKQKETNSFDSFGALHSSVRLFWSEELNEWLNNWKYEYLYNDYENSSVRIRYDWDSAASTWINASKSETKQNESNLITMEASYMWNNTSKAWDGIGSKTIVLQYDSFGNRLLYEIYHWEALTNSWVPVYRYSNVFANNNKLWQTDFFEWNEQNSEWIKNKVRFYYYFDTNLRIKKYSDEYIVLYPNPVGNELNFEGLESGRVIVFDLLGKIHLDVSNARNSINISHLPHGSYKIKIIENNRASTKGIIKR